MPEGSHSRPVHVEHSGSFVLPLPRNEAFQLFSAEGERGWVPGWNPSYLHPAEPCNDAGTVFRTTHGDEETIWLVLGYDEDECLALYARLTPGSRVGTVGVQCDSLEEESTRVFVTYSLTAVAEAGNIFLAQFTADAYRHMLDEWRKLILTARPRADAD